MSTEPDPNGLFLKNHFPGRDQCVCGCAKTVGPKGGTFGGLQRRKCAKCGLVRKITPNGREYLEPGADRSVIVPC